MTIWTATFKRRTKQWPNKRASANYHTQATEVTQPQSAKVPLSKNALKQQAALQLFISLRADSCAALFLTTHLLKRTAH